MTKAEWAATKIEFGCKSFALPGQIRLRTEDLSGCVLGVEKSSWPIRARLSGPRSGKAVDIKVNSSGEFSLKNIAPGDYVLLFKQRDKILAIRPVRLPLELAPLVVDLTPYSEGFQQVEY